MGGHCSYLPFLPAFVCFFPLIRRTEEGNGMRDNIWERGFSFVSCILFRLPLLFTQQHLHFFCSLSLHWEYPKREKGYQGTGEYRTQQTHNKTTHTHSERFRRTHRPKACLHLQGRNTRCIFFFFSFFLFLSLLLTYLVFFSATNTKNPP
ncbi:hypothetical protein QBC38DRAFT_217390 [Podospora fimiseda]|uniref:Uncharacterized protein n=1 Tax=Podospora fimiseda TaxID=252190 RepID=A0AAN7GY32_9PEZI|nr:hypothetical protein QBC38DRAFT_217390 [Podospora fimiseda]